MKKNEHYKYINEHVIVYKFLHVLDRDCFVLIVTLLDTLYKICIQRYIKFKKKMGLKSSISTTRLVLDSILNSFCYISCDLSKCLLYKHVHVQRTIIHISIYFFVYSRGCICKLQKLTNIAKSTMHLDEQYQI